MSPVGIALFSAVRWWAWDYREFLGSDSDSGLAVVVFPHWIEETRAKGGTQTM